MKQVGVTAAAGATALADWLRQHPLWLVGITAFVARLLFVVFVGRDPFVTFDSDEYDSIARELLAGHGFTIPGAFIRPPLYSVFVAGAYVLGGIAALQLLQVVISASTVVLIGLLAQTLYRRADVAWAAALLAALYPWFFQLAGGLAPETLFTFLAVASLLGLVRAATSKSAIPVALVGVLFGLACLTRANLLVLTPVLASWLWWRSRSAKRMAFFVGGLVLVLIPFGAVNLRDGNGVVIASSGGGLSFYYGNNPETALLFSDSLAPDEWRRLNSYAGQGPISAAFLGCDVPERPQRLCDERVPRDQRERFFYEAGLRYITSATSDWTQLEVGKVVHIWTPWADPRAYPTYLVLISGISFAAILGLAVASVRRLSLPFSTLVLAVVVSVTLTNVIWLPQLRYRFALLDPVLIAVGGLAARDLIERVLGVGKPPNAIA